MWQLADYLLQRGLALAYEDINIDSMKERLKVTSHMINMVKYVNVFGELFQCLNEFLIRSTFSKILCDLTS